MLTVCGSIHTSAIIGVGILLAGHLLGADLTPAQEELAKGAHQVLVKHCGKCHGEDRNFAEDFELDRDIMEKKQLALVPGKPEESELYKQIVSGKMPKRSKDPFPKDQLKILRDWIVAGAPDWEDIRKTRRVLICVGDLLPLIEKDLIKIPEVDRRFARYFTLNHLHNSGDSPEHLENYRVALTKLLNSLSWERKIFIPVKIPDSLNVLFRIDLRDYQWDHQSWETVVSSYPYSTDNAGEIHDHIAHQVKTRTPFVRVDWFIARASVPPLYHQLLGLPETDMELERRLNVDVDKNLRDSPGRRVWRSGFSESGVSRHNRIVERHESIFGAYWKSYDFGASVGTKNIFKHPLDFKHDGGEIIFNLPNGLQGYLLVDDKGKRLDEAPVNIVFTDQGRDPVIRNGLTCMTCHTEGMKTLKNSKQLHLAIKGTIWPEDFPKDYALRLYPDANVIDKLVESDKRTFAKAIEELGGVVGGREPITLLAYRYDRPIDATIAAGELCVSKEHFLAILNEDQVLKAKGLNTLATGGTLKRETWEKLFKPAYALAQKTLRRASYNPPPANKIVLPALFRDEPFAEIYLAGHNLFNKGEWHLALEEYGDFLTKAPRHPLAPYAKLGMALAHVNSKQYKESLPILLELARAPVMGNLSGEIHSLIAKLKKSMGTGSSGAIKAKILRAKFVYRRQPNPNVLRPRKK